MVALVAAVSAMPQYGGYGGYGGQGGYGHGEQIVKDYHVSYIHENYPSNDFPIEQVIIIM